MSRNNLKINCPKCNIVVTDGIACDMCNKWFHKSVKCCGLTAKEYTDMESDKEKNWFCVTCKGKVDSPSAMFAVLLSKFNHMQGSYEQLTKEVKSTAVDQKADLDEFKRSIPQLINDAVSKKIKTVITDVNTVKSDIANIKQEIETLRSAVGSQDKGIEKKLLKVEKQSERQLRLIKRNDILVTGVPNTISDLIEVVVAMLKVLDAGISIEDISNCCYLNKTKSIILVSLLSLQKRNMIMSKYFKLKKLNLSMFMSTDVQSRVYFNDNLPPKLSFMVKLARHLKKTGNIKGFSVGLSHISLKTLDDTVKNYSTVEEFLATYPDLESAVTAKSSDPGPAAS